MASLFLLQLRRLTHAGFTPRMQAGSGGLYPDLRQFQLSLCIAWGWVLKRSPEYSLLPTAIDNLLARGKCQAGLSGTLGVQRHMRRNVLRTAVHIGTGSWRWKGMGGPQDVKSDQHLLQEGIPQLAGHEGRGNCWKGEGELPSAGEPAGWETSICREAVG